MTSFTAASGPLDDALRAHELLAGVADAMRRIDTRARRAGDEDVAVAAFLAAAAAGESHHLLGDGIERLRELEQLILGRTWGEET